MTTDEYHALVRAGVLANVELIDGRVVMGEYELIFSPAQAAAAAELGVSVPSCAKTIAAPSRTDSDEQVRRRLSLMTELRESGDRHARAAVAALRSLAAQLRARAR
jgi:hypothetical protein